MFTWHGGGADVEALLALTIAGYDTSNEDENGD